MDRKKVSLNRKSKSTSRVSLRAHKTKMKSAEDLVPPNTQVFTSRCNSPRSATTAVLPFGKPIPKKASTSRQRRVHHSTLPPVRRSFYVKRESDSSSSHSVQDVAAQLSKQKIIEKTRQKAKSVKKQEEDTSWIYRVDENATPVDSEENDQNTHTRNNMNTYEKNISSCLKAFAEKCGTFTVEMLRNEFYSLPIPYPTEYVVFGDPSNACKNRYSNIPCLDSSRILLEFLLFEDGGGYIHANRVTYPLLRNQFILTQGPLPRTVPEFWRMIWQENVETIIMLCKNVENGRRKCAEYFSNHFDIPSSYVNGQLTIFLRTRYQESDMIVSTMELRYLSNSRRIMHYQWVGWPDCQAPAENAQSMFTMLRRVRGSKTPVVVHCSAGVGRSGTMVALEMCLMTIANLQPVDIHGIVSSLRRCRALAVQTLDQYLSLYKLVLQFGEQNGCITAEDVSSFYKVLQAARY